MNRFAPVYDIIGVGFGPSNLALAIALKESGAANTLKFCFLEKQVQFVWHEDMMLDGSRMQISFLKDLATLRNPTSPFTFINYLHHRNRLSDFINLKTFFPSRNEFNDYMAWAAAHFDDQCHYAEEVLRIEPIETDHGVEMLRVISRNSHGEHARLTRNLVLGSGGGANIPESMQALMSNPAVFHSSNYLSRVERFAGKRKIAVIGAGQSAVEIFIDLTNRFPKSCVDLITRSYTLRPSDDSPFVNEIFNPEFIDEIFAKPEHRRMELLQQFENTNYAAGDIDLIEEIFRRFYEQKVSGNIQHRFLRQYEIEEADDLGNGITLQLRQPELDRTSCERYDGVILATGYSRTTHKKMLGPVAQYIVSMNADRNYQLKTHGSFKPGIFLQGYCETTHGLSDTLLSVLPIRSAHILQRLMHLRAEVQPDSPAITEMVAL